MRLSSFLLLSVALHATALTYPLVFRGSPGETLFPVVVLSLAEGTGEGAKGDGRAEGEKGQPAGPRHFAPLPQAEQRSDEEKKQTAEAKISSEISLNLADTPEGLAIASAPAPPAETVGILLTQQGNGSGGAGGLGGKGNSGVGTGSGIGNGDGIGGMKFVQASYAYSPKPEYPDKARREGREGRVLLRVLVDEQGTSKSIEVNRSSGSDALDLAAREAIKRWRFSPARYGDKPVESWVRIPIEFRLTDAKD